MRKKRKVYSPIDGSLYHTYELSSEEDVIRAIDKARMAQIEWAKSSLSHRKQLCSQALECFAELKDVVANELTWQMGRPIKYSEGEVNSFIDRSKYMISVADECLATITTAEKDGFDRFIKKTPVGVVAVIAPWNYPLHTPINAIIPALLAGNTVILKHSAQTPLCAERIVEAFNNAGFPEGVIQYLHLSHDNTTLLIQQEAVQSVAFTGSVEAGKAIETSVAGRFINLGLELGGKDPAYVREDADIDYAVESTVDGAYFNSGQSCCGIERLYIHETIYEEFVEKFIASVKKLKLGLSNDPAVTTGPLVRASAAKFVRNQIQEAIDSGAVAHINSTENELDQSGTAYVVPQVLTNVDHSMRVMTEETFGPVVGIMKVSSDEEAITLMNDSDLGLSAAIYTSDYELGALLGDRVECGTFFINRCDFLDPELVWTGVKNTGRGYSLSKLGFNNFVQAKSFHIKKI